jgi:hypothetical protein
VLRRSQRLSEGREMKRLEISRDSWHYRLALFGLLNAERTETDLCRYFWALVRGVLRAPFLAVVGAGLAYVMVLSPVLCFVVWLQYGHLPTPFALFAGGVAWLCVVWFCFLVYLQERRNARRNAPPGVIKSAYHGWKDKTCVLVEIA